ncbi:MAG: electron transfer flavoprotein subunit alpha/FixB family protein [Candidatus Krumholzibacteriota bacterium]|nr:electron transfer flavoprotein subunit alpha/FixB family protein [Candidatus Krumholzibacteriota bacterium]
MANDVLVFGELRGGEIKKVVRELIAAGKVITESTGGSIDAVLMGRGSENEAEKVRKLGLRKIAVLSDEILDNYSTEGYAEALAGMIKEEGYGYILLGATAMGRDLGPRTAAKVDGVMFSDCVDLRVEGTSLVARRPVYSGKLLIDITPVGDHPVFVTIRPNNIAPAGEGADSSDVVQRPSGVTREMIRAIATEIVPLSGGRPDVSEADVIVSGGRAMKDAANFKLLGDLADLFGGAVGASRAAVDAGFAEQPLQVGQTGKVVNPKLYIACGISGAIQHLAGMRTSKVIVAINKDPNAPIFEKAHYGIVGDLFEIVPILTEEIKKLLN